MPQSRLSTVAPEIEAALAKMGAEESRAVGWIAARWAIQKVQLSHPVIDEIVSSGGRGGALASVVEELDAAYFGLQESRDAGGASEDEVRRAFSLARAASALDFAARGEPLEALYEAGTATGDWAQLGALVTSKRGDT
jgi:hypothetical protein